MTTLLDDVLTIPERSAAEDCVLRLTDSRLNKVVERRTGVLGIFPNTAALHRLPGGDLVEALDEWQVTDCRCSQ